MRPWGSAGVLWFPAKIRPAKFQINLRARIQDPNRGQGFRLGTWVLVLKLIWNLEEGNIRRADSSALRRSDFSNNQVLCWRGVAEKFNTLLG